MRAPWGAAAALAGTLSLAAMAAPPATEAVLENDALRLTVGTAGGARLTGLYDRAQRRNLLRPGGSTPLYQIELVRDGTTVTIDAGQADGTRLDRPDASTAVLRSRHARHGVEVVNTIRLPRGAGAAEIGTEVLREGDLPVIGIVRTPGLAVPVRQGREATSALLPVADGEVIGNLATALRDGEVRSWNYPGLASAQLMALFDRRGGIVVWSADGSGQFKRLALRRIGGDALVYFEHVLAHLSGPRVAVPYTVRLAGFEGGWEAAADVYKTWALDQPWCARRIEARNLPPPARDASFFLGVNLREARGPSGAVDRGPEVPDLAAGWGRGLGLPVNAILLSWEKRGPWITPDVFPPFGDDEPFRLLVERLHGQGHRAALFLSGLNITLEKSARNGAPAYRMAEDQAAPFRPDAIAGRDGAPLVEGTAAGEGLGRHLVLCPSTTRARRLLEESARRALDYGVDVVQVDQIPGGGTPPCFSRSHGHPPAGGPSAWRSLAAILDSLRKQAAARRPPAAVSIEEPGELFIPHVDLFHCREYFQGMWPRDGRGSTGVPLFAYLYHEFAPGYGGDSAPIATRREDPTLALYAQAMNLVTGRLPGAAVWMRMIPFSDVHPAQAAFMRDAAGLFGSEAGPFLLRGRIVRLDVPENPRAIRGRLGKTPYAFPAPRLMARGFALGAGDVGFLYVNATDEPLAVRLDLGPGPDRARAVTVWPDPGRTLADGAPITMKPRQILFLRLEGS